MSAVTWTTATELFVPLACGGGKIFEEYELIGVKFSEEPRADGCRSCYARERDDDNNPSAYVDGNTAKYKDSKHGREIHIWQLAANVGLHGGDWQAARIFYFDKYGVDYPGKKKGKKGSKDSSSAAGSAPKKSPASRKPRKDWRDEVHPEREGQAATQFTKEFVIKKKKPDEKKSGFTHDALMAAGGFYSRWPHDGRLKADGSVVNPFAQVVGVPVYGPAIIEPSTTTIDDTHAVGAVIWNKNATPFEDRRNDKDGNEVVEEIKMRTVVTGDGLIGRHGIQIIIDDRARVARGEPSQIDRIWKLEGPTDLFALSSVMPPERREREPIVSLAGGSTSVPPWTAEVVRGYATYTLHDLDDAGEAGALKTCETWGPTAKAVYHVRLPGEVTGKKGADVRDRIIGGMTYDDIDGLTLFAEPFAVTDAHREALVKALALPPAGADDGPKQFSNARTIEDEEGNKTHKPKTLAEIDADLRALTNDEPKRCGKLLFVQDGREVRYIDTAAALIGFANRKTGKPVAWMRGNEYPTKEELFHDQCANAPNFETVETIPHFPPRPNTFYTYTQAAGDGATLRKFLDRFNFATLLDRDLYLSYIATLFWGGPPGSRPAFGFTSPDGRGAGKTSLVKMATLLVGGYLDVSQTEDVEKVKTRLLSEEGRGYRGACMDNLKSHRYSSGGIEGFITSPWISGRDLYRGEGCRPNLITWAITLNGASLSKDMAQRTVFIHVRKPNRSGDWEESTTQFVLENRDALIADVAGFFQEPPEPLTRFTRWAAWESAVLARLPEPNDAQRLIEERQGESDVDTEEAGSVEDYFSEQLHALGYDVAADVVHIPSAIGAKWLSAALGEPKTPVSATRIVKQGHDEGTLKCLGVNPCRTNGRGMLWKPEGIADTPHTDIAERIEVKRKDQIREDSMVRTKGARQASGL